MIKYQVQVDRITPDTKRRAKKLKKVPWKAHKEWVKETPIRTGNARNKTTLVGDTIRADYPYAKRLDEGYSSQAREGMLKPTVRFLKNELDRIFRK